MTVASSISKIGETEAIFHQIVQVLLIRLQRLTAILLFMI